MERRRPAGMYAKADEKGLNESQIEHNRNTLDFLQKSVPSGRTAFQSKFISL